MAIKSVYIRKPEIQDGQIHIRDEEHRHLSVARANVGEEIEICDGIGNIWNATVSAIERRETMARIVASRHMAKDSFELILGLSLIRPAAFEYALEKAVETGVTRVIPVIAARSNVKDAGRRERWQRIIVEAAKQSKRYHHPVLDEPVSYSNALRIQAPTRIVFAERNGSALKPALAGSPVLYLVGPEGGWTDEELKSAESHGFALVGLGPTILKADTAAVVATALIRYELSAGN